MVFGSYARSCYDLLDITITNGEEPNGADCMAEHEPGDFFHRWVCGITTNG